jgi:hypothetical protein
VCWVNNHGAVSKRRPRGQNISTIASTWSWTARRFAAACSKRLGSPTGRDDVGSLLDADREWLAPAERAAPEVNYSARLLWQELQARWGFMGS